MTAGLRAGRFPGFSSDRGGETKRPTNKQLDRLGVFLLIVGAVIGMGVAWIGTLPIGLSIGMIVLALVLVAVGLTLSRKYRAKDDM